MVGQNKRRRHRGGRNRNGPKKIDNNSGIHRLFVKKDPVALIYEDQIREGKRMAELEKLNGSVE